MRTQAQARTLWCPMVRQVNHYTDRSATNRHSDASPIPGSLCIGSTCAMWRWGEECPWPQFKHCAAEDYGAQEEPERPASIPSDWIFCPDDGDGAGWREPDGIAAATRRGYCGLAGKPMGVAP